VLDRFAALLPQVRELVELLLMPYFGVTEAKRVAAA
jgi:hypothetical protein